MLQSKINRPNTSRCSSRVGELKFCHCCRGKLIKYGISSSGKQRYRCTICSTSQVSSPSINGYGSGYDKEIVQFKKEGLGIRSTARILKISPATVIRKILTIADRLDAPGNIPFNGKFQVDELHTYIGNKKREICVIFSWDKELKQAMSIAVETRSKQNLRSVVAPLLESEALNINTDRYSGYVGVVPKKIHTTIKRRNNQIERQNLNLRTHLKRLNRRTICFSKSAAVLLAVVKIYFWG